MRKLLALAPIAMLAPAIAFAHEVYVLSPETVRLAITADSPNPFTAYFGNEYNFFFWGLVCFIAMSTILAASVFHIFELQAKPFLSYVKRFAHPLVRVTAGLCLIGFGAYGNLFGTELFFSDLFGSVSVAMQWVFMASGCALFLGLGTRLIAGAMLCIYAYAGALYGFYILTYADHLGAYILLFALGGGAWSLDRALSIRGLPRILLAASSAITPYAFPVLRMLFGFGVMYAAIYAKFIHSELALQTIIQYHLTDYFPFDPLFIVLGALIIEFCAGLMLFLGVAVRWTGLFLIFWLILSQLYFREIWWVHTILFGVGLAIFCHGYDKFSLEGRVLKGRDGEPIF